MARVNILKQIKVEDRWKLVAIPRGRDGKWNWKALPEGRYFVEWHEHGKRPGKIGLLRPVRHWVERGASPSHQIVGIGNRAKMRSTSSVTGTLDRLHRFVVWFGFLMGIEMTPHNVLYDTAFETGVKVDVHSKNRKGGHSCVESATREAAEGFSPGTS